MPRIVDLTGKTYGRLRVTAQHPESTPSQKKQWATDMEQQNNRRNKRWHAMSLI